MIGIDIENVARFTRLSRHRREHLFTPEEIAYCSRFADAAMHFAGCFVAKEAASKALGTKRFPYLALEIRHEKSGAPFVVARGKKVRVALSISHTKEVAIAIALRY